MPTAEIHIDSLRNILVERINDAANGDVDTLVAYAAEILSVPSEQINYKEESEKIEVTFKAPLRDNDPFNDTERQHYTIRYR